MHFSRTVFSTSMLGLLALASSLAHAADSKVFPATFCRQAGSSSAVSYDINGRVHNPTASTQTVICPIVRDVTDSKWNQLTVVVADRHYSENVSCRAWSAQTDGLGWYQQTNTTGSFPDWWSAQELTFGTQPTERHDGTYYLECSIPPRYSGLDSGVLSYRITEP
ncbi:hypothetical protein WMF20_42025 [Sorangium sp. So ce834]|uniref:hypothetical protein n=1 Tax=Sorangium sp. So ce834 TaxID=3133321 RepID=UPI003F5E61B4